MSTFQQSCPGCGRTLELPTAATGRLGKCPACEATFTIGDSKDTDANSLPASAAETPEPIDSPADRGVPDRAFADEPLASSASLPAARPLQITECEIEALLSTTLSIFAARWKSCVAPFAILVVVTLLLVVPPMAILHEINKAGLTTLARVGFVCLLPLVFGFSGFAAVGLARVAMVVAKNEAGPPSPFSAPTEVILRALAAALLLSFVSGVVTIALFSVVRITEAAGAKTLAGLLTILAGFASFVLAFILAWLLWAWLFVCADEKGTSIGSIRAAQAISSQNKLASFFIVLIALGLAILGTLLCVVGHLVTAPLTILLFAVSYLMMTGQSVSHPKDVSAAGRPKNVF